MRCSVVIPSYNRLNVLPRAVASVLAHDEPDFELIIVDDSTDATRDWLAKLTDRRVKVILPERRRGVSAARNLGIAAARAPVVAFLDSDDCYLPQRLRRALDVLDREPDLVCTLSSARKEVRKGMRASPLPRIKLGPQAFEWALYSDLIRKLGSYLVSKILVSDLRHGDFATLATDWSAFRRAGLLRGGLARIWRDHREVRNYRRAMSNRYALAQLAGAPAEWA